jgi:hypothetical protein
MAVKPTINSWKTTKQGSFERSRAHHHQRLEPFYSFWMRLAARARTKLQGNDDPAQQQGLGEAATRWQRRAKPQRWNDAMGTLKRVA